MLSLAPEIRQFLTKFEKSYPKGQIIIKEGDIANHIYILIDGRVVTTKHIRGKDKFLFELYPIDIFGYEALKENCNYLFTVSTITDSKIVEFNANTLKGFITEKPELSINIVNAIINHHNFLVTRLEIESIEDKESKVIKTILWFYNFYSSKGTKVDKLPLTPLLLSNITELEIDQVKSIVTQLENNNYIEILQDGLRIKEVTGLEKLYNLLGQKQKLAIK